MRIAITGSTGFIGQHLIEQIRVTKKNIEIIEISRRTGIDILDKDKLFELKDIDIVIHLAGKSFVPDSYEYPFDFFETNVVGTLNILELCRRNSARLILASTYLYGPPDYLPIDENHKVVDSNPYAATKLASEYLAESFSKYYSLNSLALRIFNIYGEGQNENFLIPKIIKQAKSGVIMLEDPNPKRDFLHIQDLISLMLIIIDSEFNFRFEIFNVGSGTSYSVRDIVSLIQKFHKGQEIQVFFSGKKREGEIAETVCDINKVSSYFNWSPKYTLSKGLEQVIKMFNLHNY